MKTLKHFFTLLIASILSILLSACEKEQNKLDQQEQEIIEKLEVFIPVQIIGQLDDHFKDVRYEKDYPIYLDSFNVAVDELIDAIELNFSLQEYQEALNHILNMEQSGKKGAFDYCWDLGYAKGVELNLKVDATITAIVSAGIHATGGGGAQIVYDLFNLDRQVYHYSYCGTGFSAGIGLAMEVGPGASVGFSGINEILTNIPYHGRNSGINKFQGAAISKTHTIDVSVKTVFGLSPSIGFGFSQEASADLSGINNLNPCISNMSVIEDGVKRYSLAVSGSISVSFSAGLLAAYNNTTLGINSIGIDETYKIYSNRRPLAGLKMAKEILLTSVFPGIYSLVNPGDIIASAIAIKNGAKINPDCEAIGVVDLSVYPNPTSGLITILFDRPDYYFIEITSKAGALMYSTTLPGGELTVDVDMTEFANGEYLVTARSNGLMGEVSVTKI